MSAIYPYMFENYRPPEGLFAKPGYSELLVYHDSTADVPGYPDIDMKNLIRAKDWDLYPKFESHVDEDLINGLPDHNMFSVNPVSMEGTFSTDLGGVFGYHIDYFTARLFEHMRQAWMGIADSGALVSPREEWIAEHPWFTIGSAYHGTFVQCLVNKFSITIKPEDPVALEWGIGATQYIPQNAFAVQNMRPLVQFPQYENERRMIYGRDFRITRESGDVVGHFGMQDASNSIFAEGVNKPGLYDDTLTSLTLEFDNRLEAQYTMKSHNLDDPRARFEENIFPNCYGMTGQRNISGTIEWFGNSTPLTFIEKLTGPGSIQNGGSMILDCKFLKLNLKEIVWNLSDKNFSLEDKMSRQAKFSVASDGWLSIPYYEADFS